MCRGRCAYLCPHGAYRTSPCSFRAVSSLHALPAVGVRQVSQQGASTMKRFSQGCNVHVHSGGLEHQRIMLGLHRCPQGTDAHAAQRSHSRWAVSNCASKNAVSNSAFRAFAFASLAFASAMSASATSRRALASAATAAVATLQGRPSGFTGRQQVTGMQRLL